MQWLRMQRKDPVTAVVRDFRSNLRVLEREVVSQLEGETSCCGVTLAQCHTLLELSQREPSLTALADALDLDKSTLSRTVESMVQSGLCQRTTVAGDRRSVRLTLSPLGRSKVDTINRTCDEYYGALLGQLSESEQRQVVRAVRILADAMKRWRTAHAANPSRCGVQSAVKNTRGSCVAPTTKKKPSIKKGPTP
jgi:DNA-binding MarR family transcriptional regulator